MINKEIGATCFVTLGLGTAKSTTRLGKEKYTKLRNLRRYSWL